LENNLLKNSNGTVFSMGHPLDKEIQICSNKGAGPFWGPVRGKIRKLLINLLLINHWPECIDI